MIDATCDGIDDDCDGVADADLACHDDDGDGFAEDEGDCDDSDAKIHPGATVGHGRHGADA